MIHKFKSLFNKSDLFRNLFTLITGTVFAQIIPIILQPFLRRFYAPEDFGMYAIYLGVISVFAVVINGKYDMAVVLPEKDEDANQIVGVSLFFSIVVTLLLLVIAIFFEDNILHFLKIPLEEKYILFILPVGILFTGFYQAINFWLVRKKQFKKSSINKVSRRAAEGIIQLSYGYSKSGSVGLVVGAVVGNITNIIVGIKQASSEELKFSHLSFDKMKVLAKRYKEFPLYNMLPALLNSASLIMPVFMINSFFSAYEVGQFDLSRQILAIPLSLVSVSLSQVLFQHVSEAKNKKQSVKPVIFKIIKNLLMLSIVAVIVIEFFGVAIFELVFGNQWEQAAILTKVLIYSYMIKFIVSPMSIILTAFEKLKIVAVWQVIYFVLVSSLWLIKGIALIDFIIAIVVVDVFAYLIYFALIYKAILSYETKLI